MECPYDLRTARFAYLVTYWVSVIDAPEHLKSFMHKISFDTEIAQPSDMVEPSCSVPTAVPMTCPR